MAAPVDTLQTALSRARRKGRDLVVSAVAAARPTRPVFVWGCQRSGSTMLLRLLGRSPWCTVYHEDNPEAMVRPARLRDVETIRRLVERDSRVFVIFKPLNDSQHARRHLALDERARGLWIYRDCRDSVESMVAAWGDSQKRIYTWIARTGGEAADAEDVADLAVFAQNMAPDTLELVRRHATPDIPLEEGAALHWYCRNRLFFDLGLDRDPRVELVRYRDVVTDPDRYLRRVFEFVGCGYRPAWGEGVFRSSLDKPDAPRIAAPVARACEELRARLDAAYARQMAGDEGPPRDLSPREV